MHLATRRHIPEECIDRPVSSSDLVSSSQVVSCCPGNGVISVIDDLFCCAVTKGCVSIVTPCNSERKLFSAAVAFAQD
jgi:hypothetical protein